MTKPHERARDLHDAKDIPAWRQLITNGEIVADRADTKGAYYIGGERAE